MHVAWCVVLCAQYRVQVAWYSVLACTEPTCRMHAACCSVHGAERCVPGTDCMVPRAGLHGAGCRMHIAWSPMHGASCKRHIAWGPMHGASCRMHTAWNPVHGAGCRMHGAQCTVLDAFDAQSLVLAVGCPVPVARCRLQDALCMVLDTQSPYNTCLVPGVLSECPVPAAWCRLHGTQSPIPTAGCPVLAGGC